ncbi:succinyl-CoA:acetate/propanoyl-CoA:succinate CoA transferase isoform X1 [Megalopta genalis]|uniref:succinyl-CoA:acetate/propanoyl-CoA:succinate CoA transferase isoform X1 n=1 Tax=Megalopta genalis TaxID=115081 RepID=UPI0014437B34|nr:4-hydroxybutyrate coenzyme A transferase-like isoform X1 [Megalopta genalis]
MFGFNLRRKLESLNATFNNLVDKRNFNLCGLKFIREPLQPLKRCPRWVCVEDAVKIINSEHLVFIQGGAATPNELIRAMTEHGVCNNLRGVRLIHMGLEGDAPFASPEFEKHFRSVSFYIGANVREAVNEGRADYIPIFLHEVPKLFYEKRIIPDVALIHVSVPDARGFCSLGVSVDCTRAALSTAKVIIAQVNEHMPRSFGDSIIHCSHIDWAVKYNCPLPCVASCPPNDIEAEIGKIIAQRLIDDGATLQLGIGNIPDAILCSLGNHKDLGIHSEIMGDTMVDLAERGNITNKMKLKHRGRMVASLAIGTKRVYDFIHSNPFVEMLTINYVNDPRVISQQPKMTAINSCIEMDITGQICSDSLGCKMYSGFGGQLDFIRGAAMGQDGRGKAVIAFPSVTSKGESKIQPVLKVGGGVVVTRAHAHYIVTEHGVANVFGKTLRQRANALIQIAHPDHRECLEKAAYERLKTNPTKYL